MVVLRPESVKWAQKAQKPAKMIRAEPNFRRFMLESATHARFCRAFPQPYEDAGKKWEMAYWVLQRMAQAVEIREAGLGGPVLFSDRREKVAGTPLAGPEEDSQMAVRLPVCTGTEAFHRQRTIWCPGTSEMGMGGAL